MQALNYFIAQKYVEAIAQIGQASNSRLVLMPMEFSSLVSTIGGIGELTRKLSAASDKGSGD